jgi:hypothetical protein
MEHGLRLTTYDQRLTTKKNLQQRVLYRIFTCFPFELLLNGTILPKCEAKINKLLKLGKDFF